MSRQPAKRPQMDTELSTIPNAPASDRSPVAKMQTLRRDGSDPLTPERTPSLSEMSEELGPSNLLLGNATTADEAEQMTEAMPRKIPSTHETMAAQTSTSKHDQKHTTSPASWTHALECTWPARLPLPARFRDAMPSSTAPPTLLRARSLPLPPRHPQRLVVRVKIWNSLAPND